jgi:hypothetical protein
MRLFVALVALGALSQTAFAQTPDCKSIADSAARLACYDRAGPPAAARPAAPVAATPGAPAVARPGAPVAATPGAPARKPAVSKVDQTKYVDSISAEDALMNAKLKNICRGC